MHLICSCHCKNYCIGIRNELQTHVTNLILNILWLISCSPFHYIITSTMLMISMAIYTKQMQTCRDACNAGQINQSEIQHMRGEYLEVDGLVRDPFVSSCGSLLTQEWSTSLNTLQWRPEQPWSGVHLFLSISLLESHWNRKSVVQVSAEIHPIHLFMPRETKSWIFRNATNTDTVLT